MCRAARCPIESCSGLTWAGCGMHIPSVMDGIPKDEWCKCPKPEGSEYPPSALQSVRERKAAEKAAAEKAAAEKATNQ